MKQSEALGAGPPRDGSSWTALAPEFASPHAHAAFQGADSPGWRAELELRFAHRHGRTRLAHRWHRGPLRIQRPFYPANPHGGDTCQVVILHPPAGVVGGDRLAMDIGLEAGSQALITTPGATKFYRSAGAEAVQQARIRVGAGATLEWTPQETILFDGCRARIETRVELAAGARFLGWEITALGRPAARAPFATGRCRQRFEISREGAPIWIERGEHRGGGESLAGRWGLAGRDAVGVMVCTGGSESVIAALRRELEGFAGEGCLAGVTRRGELSVLRVLAPETRPIFDLFASLRELALGEPTPAARIWAT
ncbi:MAG: urease accessory protein UreD [Myxococcota bacterium]|nr:urease accessory protein UreD [Myxococcota bacterium]